MLVPGATQALGVDSAVVQEVVTLASSGGEELALGLLEALLPHREVSLVGLNAAELNGCTGVVLDTPRQNERFPVLLHKDLPLVKPAEWFGGSWVPGSSGSAARAKQALAGPFARLLGGEGEQAGRFVRPRGIAIDARGRLHVSEMRRVQTLDPATGEPLHVVQFDGAACCLAGMCVAGGHLVVADRGAHALHVLAIAGGAYAEALQRDIRTAVDTFQLEEGVAALV